MKEEYTVRFEAVQTQLEEAKRELGEKELLVSKLRAGVEERDSDIDNLR